MTPTWFKRDLQPGDTGRDVSTVQRLLGLAVTGTYDERTETVVRGKQKKGKLAETGEVDEKTAEVLGERATAGMVPEWYHRTLDVLQTGEDVAFVNSVLDLMSEGDIYSANTEDAVRRFQSAEGLDVNGRVDEATAKVIGDM